MRVVVVSLALHAAAFALVLRTPIRERAPDLPPPIPIEIVEDEPPARPINEGPAELGVHGAPSRIAAASVRRGTAGVPAMTASETASLGNEASVGAAAAEPSGSAPATWSLPLTTTALGIGRENPFLPSSPPPPIASNKPDLGLRFGPTSDGPVIVALKDATSSSLAPVNGRARFTIRANAEGVVLGVDLDDATGGSGWDDARRLAFEGLRGKKLIVPPGARGINMRFEVVSDVSYPSGQKTRGEFGVRDGAVVLPDESNIGAKPTRKIHARALGTEVL